MAAADTARLIASLELKDQFSGPAGRITKSLGNLDRGITNTQGRAFKAGQQIGTGIRNTALLAAGAVGLLATQVGIGLRSLTELESATTQTNAVLKSTSGIAGQTAESIRKLAEQFESMNATIDDKVIQSGENLLLTFTNIRKEAFEPALLAALNMNQALGGGEEGLQGTIQKLGKALNDPIKGLTSLGRVGITFTAQQKEQIKTAVKAGDTFKAQGIILAELDKRFGGSFLAGGGTTTGKVAKFKDAIDDLQRVLATALLPVIGKVADALQKFLADPRVIKAANDLGNSIAGLFSDKNLAEGGRILGTFFDTAKAAAPVLKAAGESLLTIVKGAVGLFRSLPEGIQQLAIGAFAINKLTGGLVTNIAGGLISAIISQFKPLMNVNAGVVNVNGGVGGIGAAAGAGGGLRGALGTAASLVSKVVVVGMVAEVADLIHGAISPGGGLEGRTGTGALLPADQLSWPFGPKNTPKIDIGPFHNLFGGDSAFATTPPTAPSAPSLLGGVAATAAAAMGSLSITVGGFDARVKASNVTLGGFDKRLADTSNGFRKMLDTLASAKTPKDIAAAVKAALALVVGQRRGSAAATSKVLVDLKGQLLHTTDPETRRILKAAIVQVEHKLVGRQLVQKQLDKADQIFKSSKSTTDKIRDLTAIERGLAHTSKSGQAKVAAQLEKVRAAAKHAGDVAAEATRRKKQLLKVNVSVPITANISLRETIATRTTYRRVGNVIIS